MKQILLLIVLSFVFLSASSMPISQEQADEIVQNHLRNEMTQFDFLYVNVNVPSEDGIVITTSNGEVFRAKYACWAYYVNEKGLSNRRYFFVKEEGGSLLEVIVSNESDSGEPTASWVVMPTGLTEREADIKLLYPNPVGDLLTIPCHGKNVRVEIYNLKGSCLFSELLSGKDSFQLNVSFLKTGSYMVNISGETYKIIKY